MPNNPISAFLVDNIVIVFFAYGLAFFAMGLALALASRRASQFRFARAIRPLAAFGILHGIHEWVEMFQRIAAEGGHSPSLWEEIPRLGLLAVSFLLVATFALLLLEPVRQPASRRPYRYVGAMAGVWAVGLAAAWLWFKPDIAGTIDLADVLARYTLGIPGALLGCWALMRQQRTFRESGMPQFGRDLVWCATALFLYGAIGQLFVRSSPLPPSNVFNSALFLSWFGIPVQLFRAATASVLAINMMRALNAFDVEGQRRLEEAHAATLRAQSELLEAERLTTRQMERLNEELRLRARELSLLVELSNLLAAATNLPEGLRTVLAKSVDRLNFPAAAMILLVNRQTRSAALAASVGFQTIDGDGTTPLVDDGKALAQRSITQSSVICRHLDGVTFEFAPQDPAARQECHAHPSPTMMVSFPLIVRRETIGSIVFSCASPDDVRPLELDEYQLMLGIAQQLALSIENARLHQQAQERERVQSELLRQVVSAQEAERQRIARELHDATGQSLTAVALGLRGVESTLGGDPAMARQQVKELRSFTTEALGELRHIIADLRPSQLDDLGLVAALQWYAGEFEKHYLVPTRFVVEGERTRLPAEYETVLFRITQEALNNIAKHAQATLATIQLKMSSTRIQLSVSDDGRGFDPHEVLRRDRPRTGWGLLGIMERAWLLGGECNIHTNPGRGTRIDVSVPLNLETMQAPGASETK